MSKIAEDIYDVLRKVFPACTIQKELYVKYKFTRLFFDFYIRELGVFIEVQGRQHTEFVKHFHGDKETFQAQKRRDNMKLQYVQENGEYCLVRFHYDEKVTEDLVRRKLDEALNGGFCE
jgi:very-short-patch-repair endonuclease